MKRSALVLAAVTMLATSAATAQTADERAAEAGLGLVVRYCDVCHGLRRALNPPTLALPLLGLAPRSGGGAGWLSARLGEPHPALKTALSAQQIDDIAAYLASLAGRKPSRP